MSSSSWFDTKQFTSYAKTALFEAQKQIDKALDINDPNAVSKKDSAPVKDETVKTQDVSPVESVKTPDSDSFDANKLWGSFTGSFFDAGQIGKTSDKRKNSLKNESKTIQEEPVISTQPFESSSKLSNPFNTDNVLKTSASSISSSSSAVMEEVNTEDLSLLIQPIQVECDTSKKSSSDGFSESLQLVSPPGDEDFKSGDSMVKSLLEINEASVESSCVLEDLQSSMSSSDKTMIPPVSSNESQIFESTSTVEEPIECSKDLVTQDIDKTSENDQESTSSNNKVNDLLDEAIAENEPARSEESGSSKSYEIVKTECSFPTSGDEYETTTTSSDIEVISSPIGHLRNISPARISQSVASIKVSHGSKKSHTRTSSGASEESSNPDNERLLRKISELSEILEARETKLVELSKANLEFNEKNTDLNSQVKEAMRINAKLSENCLNTEDLTNRMSELEMKLQKTLADKEKLENENKKLIKEASNQQSLSNLKESLYEKDEIIEDLRREGESLSKKLGKHSEAMKKLRNKEKTTDKEIKSLKTELQDKKTECERLKKSLGAKDEVESNQIEAIQNLTTANSKWEGEHNKLKSDYEDSQEKVLSLKSSLEASYKEIAELKRGLIEKDGEAQEMALSKEMAAKQALQEQLRELQEQSRREKENLYLQIDELRNSLSNEERSSMRREEQLKQEREDLMARLEQSENRHEELSGSVSAATRPLLRQIESLQANLNEAQASGERVERSLSERLQHSTIQLAAAQERERTAAEQYMIASGKLATAESKITNLKKEKSSIESQMEEFNKKIQDLEVVSSKATNQIAAMKKSFAEEIEEVKKEKDFLEASLDSEKAFLSSEKRKNIALAEQLKDRDRRIREIQSDLDLYRTQHHNYSERTSPTPSQLSISGSISDNFGNQWPDEAYSSVSAHSSNLYDSMRQTNASTTALVEGLQSQLKLRDGELLQLQMEVGNLERSRENLSVEVTRLTEKLEHFDSIELKFDSLKKEYTDIAQKHQTILTMYGEKVEEAEELRLDLADVKEMYKCQIQELIQTRNS